MNVTPIDHDPGDDACMQTRFDRSDWFKFIGCITAAVLITAGIVWKFSREQSVSEKVVIDKITSNRELIITELASLKEIVIDRLARLESDQANVRRRLDQLEQN